MSDDLAPTRPKAREGKLQIGAYLPPESFFTFKELLTKLGRERGKTVTMQDAVAMALQEFGQKRGIDLKLG